MRRIAVVLMVFGSAITLLAQAPTSRPDVITAVQEQFGLRLVAGKAPGNAFIIERIERPTPD